MNAQVPYGTLSGGTVSATAMRTAEPENLVVESQNTENAIKALYERLATLEQRLAPVLLPEATGTGKPENGPALPLMSSLRSETARHRDGVRVAEITVSRLLSRLDLP